MANTYEIRLYETRVHTLTLPSSKSQEELMEGVLEDTQSFLQMAHVSDAWIDTVEVELVEGLPASPEPARAAKGEGAS